MADKRNPMVELSRELLARSRNMGAYPEPHTDEDDSCMCPDHVYMRRARLEDDDA